MCSAPTFAIKPEERRNLRRRKTKASFFHAFESGPRQRWEVARTVVSSANNFSLSCRYPLKTEDHRFGGFLTGLYMLACDGLQKITLRRVIFWRRVTWMLSYWLRRFYGRKTIRTLGTLTRNLPFQANPNKVRRTWLVAINLGGCSQKSP